MRWVRDAHCLVRISGQEMQVVTRLSRNRRNKSYFSVFRRFSRIACVVSTNSTETNGHAERKAEGTLKNAATMKIRYVRNACYNLVTHTRDSVGVLNAFRSCSLNMSDKPVTLFRRAVSSHFVPCKPLNTRTISQKISFVLSHRHRRGSYPFLGGSVRTNA